MKTKWIHKNNNQQCILFFNGWGMDENCVNHIDAGDYDILMCYDYSNQPETVVLDDYKDVYLIAWSLGVYSAALFLKKHSIAIKKSIAINGTLKPVHDTCGLSPSVFASTLNNWNTINRTKFNMRMFGGRAEYSQMMQYWPQRTVDNQYDELFYFKNTIEKQEEIEYPFDAALVGNQDLIFATSNQINYWKHKTTIKLKDIPHFPFKEVKSWQELIEI